jgi:hypothetical protein
MIEGVVEIQINNQPCKGINLTTWHTQARRHHEWQQFTTWSTSRVGSYLTLVPSSTSMPRRTHRGWPKHYPIVHPWSEVRYHPTHRHMMLLSLEIPYVPYVSVYFKCLFIQTQPTWALINIGRGYHLGAPNLRSSPLSTVPSSILHFPLIAPSGLQLWQPFDHLTKPHRTSIDRKGPYREQIPTTHLVPIAYTIKRNILSFCFFHRGKQSGLVWVFLVQLGFH